MTIGRIVGEKCELLPGEKKNDSYVIQLLQKNVIALVGTYHIDNTTNLLYKEGGSYYKLKRGDI